MGPPTTATAQATLLGTAPSPESTASVPPTLPMEDLRATIVDVVKATMAELSRTTPPPPSEPEAPIEEENGDF